MLAPCDPEPPRYHGDGALIRHGGGFRGLEGGGGREGGGRGRRGEGQGGGAHLCVNHSHIKAFQRSGREWG